MSGLGSLFSRLKKERKKALIAYLAGGYPDWKNQKSLILAMDKAGVDILELGVPFSDPIADGPTIQFASQQSLDHGTSLSQILRWAKSIKDQVHMPFVIMSYLNPIMRFGISRFAKIAYQSGVRGVIVPDLIMEEGKGLKAALAKEGIDMIYLVAPTTPPSRQKIIIKETSGFLYAVSVRGVTGARKKLPVETKKWLKSLKKGTSKPVCVGFGISGTEQIKMLKNAVDGFIVGSAFIDIIKKAPPAQMQHRVVNFVKTLAKECAYGR